MTVSVDDVLEGAGAAGEADEAIATTVLAEAEEYVGTYITRNLLVAENTVPEVLEDAAVLRCATELFARRKAPFGQQVATDANGTLVTTRLGADPLGGVRPMLRGYCFEVGFAFPDVDYTAL
jgi:hypothetical protein